MRRREGCRDGAQHRVDLAARRCARRSGVPMRGESGTERLAREVKLEQLRNGERPAAVGDLREDPLRLGHGGVMLEHRAVLLTAIEEVQLCLSK